MQKRILLVHGIFSKEGTCNIWHMKAPLETATGLPVTVFEYGYVHPVDAWLSNPTVAKRLAHVMEPGDIVVCHSNGAAVTYLATMNERARPCGVVMINPALDEWLLPRCDWAHVYYNAEDKVVWWSHLLPGNIWGQMGRVGFIDADAGEKFALPDQVVCPVFEGRITQTRVRQEDTINDAYFFRVPPARGHLSMFQRPCVEPWGHVVGKRILAELPMPAKFR